MFFRFAVVAALLCTIIGGAGRTASAAGVCEDPQFPKAIEPRECRVFYLKLDNGRETTTVNVIQIGVARISSGGADPILYRHFLVKPGVATIDLGEFPQFEGRQIQPLIFRKLGLEALWRSWRLDSQIVFERSLSESGGKYCLIYTLKHPFVGSLMDCGSQELSSDIGYAANTRTPEQAQQAICASFGRDAGAPCPTGDDQAATLRLRRAADGQLQYVKLLRAPDSAGGDFYVYAVNATGGAPELLAKGKDVQWNKY